MKDMEGAEEELFISKSENIQSIHRKQEEKLCKELGHVVGLKSDGCLCESDSNCKCLWRLGEENGQTRSTV